MARVVSLNAAAAVAAFSQILNATRSTQYSPTEFGKLVDRTARTVYRWLKSLEIELDGDGKISRAAALELLARISPPDVRDQIAEAVRQELAGSAGNPEPTAFRRPFDISGLDLMNWMRRVQAHGHELQGLVQRLLRRTAEVAGMAADDIETMGRVDQSDSGVDAAVHRPANSSTFEIRRRFDPLGILDQRTILQAKASLPSQSKLADERTSVADFINQGYRYALFVGQSLGRQQAQGLLMKIQGAFDDRAMLIDADSLALWLSAFPVMARDLDVEVGPLAFLQTPEIFLRELRDEISNFVEDRWREQYGAIRRFALGELPSRLMVVYGNDQVGKSRTVLEALDSVRGEWGNRHDVAILTPTSQQEALDVVRSLADRSGIVVLDDADAAWAEDINRALIATEVGTFRVILINRNPDHFDPDVAQTQELESSPVRLVFRVSEPGDALTKRQFAHFLMQAGVVRHDRALDSDGRTPADIAYEIANLSGCNARLAVHMAAQASRARTTLDLALLNLNSNDQIVLAAVSMFSVLPPRATDLLDALAALFGISVETWRTVIDRLHRRGFLVNDPYHLYVPSDKLAEEMLPIAFRWLIPGPSRSLDGPKASRIFDVLRTGLIRQLRPYNLERYAADLIERFQFRITRTDEANLEPLRHAMFDDVASGADDWVSFGDQCREYRSSIKRVLLCLPERACDLLERLTAMPAAGREYPASLGVDTAAAVAQDLCWSPEENIFARAEAVLRNLARTNDQALSAWREIWSAWAANTQVPWPVRFGILLRLVQQGNPMAIRALAFAHHRQSMLMFQARTIRIGRAVIFPAPRLPLTYDDITTRLAQLEGLVVSAIDACIDGALDQAIHMLADWTDIEALDRLIRLDLDDHQRFVVSRRLAELTNGNGEIDVRRGPEIPKVRQQLRVWHNALRQRSPVDEFVSDLPTISPGQDRSTVEKLCEQVIAMARAADPATIRAVVRRLRQSDDYRNQSLLVQIASAVDPHADLFEWYVQEVLGNGRFRTDASSKNILRGLFVSVHEHRSPVMLVARLRSAVSAGLECAVNSAEFELAANITTSFPDDLSGWITIPNILRNSSFARGETILDLLQFSPMLAISTADQRAIIFGAISDWVSVAEEDELESTAMRLCFSNVPRRTRARANRARIGLDFVAGVIYLQEKKDDGRVAWNVFGEPEPRAIIRSVAIQACYELRESDNSYFQQVADRLDDPDFRLQTARILFDSEEMNREEAANEVLAPIVTAHGRDILNLLSSRLAPRERAHAWAVRYRNFDIVGKFEAEAIIDWLFALDDDCRPIAARSVAAHLRRPRPTSIEPMPPNTVTVMNTIHEFDGVLDVFAKTSLHGREFHCVPSPEEFDNRIRWWRQQGNRARRLDSPQRDWMQRWADLGHACELAERDRETLRENHAIHETD